MSAFDEKMRKVADGLIEKFGQTSVLRKQTNTGDPTAPTKVNVDADVTLVDLDIFQRAKSGKMISTKNSVVTISAGPGVIPVKKDKIAIGVASTDVAPTTRFSSIVEVNPLSPSGIDLLYEVEVEGHGT